MLENRLLNSKNLDFLGHFFLKEEVDWMTFHPLLIIIIIKKKS
jgi:hypothetical protein